MKPAPFAYARPSTIEETLAVLAENEGAKVLAGGQSLLPMMNFRMAQPEILVDVNRVEALRQIDSDGEWLTIGAMVRHVDVIASSLVSRTCPLMAQAYCHIAHETVRNRGTIGGNMVHADPASEMPAVLLVVEGELVVRSLRGDRVVPAEDFVVTALTPDLEQDELLVAVRVPVQPSNRRTAIDEYALRRGDLAIAGAAVALDEVDGRCAQARIACFGVSDRAVRCSEAEALLAGSDCGTEDFRAAADAAVASIEFEGGPGITAVYRRDLTRTLVARTLKQAWANLV